MSLSDLVFVTSEDDKYLVKGGIGTATGILVNTIADNHPLRRVDWITESPSEITFVEQDRGVTRHYISRYSKGRKLPLSRFADNIDQYLRHLLDFRRFESPEKGIIIEAADWEGLAAEYFAEHDDAHILKVSRLHTPLVVCAELNRLDQSCENNLQMVREQRQLGASDLLSSPTNYILHKTFDQVLLAESVIPPTVVIPNCADVTGPSGDAQSRGGALNELRRLTGLPLPDAAFHVFVLGSVEIRKGSEIIQRSIPRLFEAIPNCHLTWIGHYATSGELTANAKVDASTFYTGIPSQWHHRVHLAGFIEHARLPAVLAAADMYALCYLGDNFPGAVLEIALAGIPMAVLLRGGIPEMIVDRGEPLAYTLGNTAHDSVENQLVTAALQVHGDPASARKLARKLKIHITQKYSAQRVAEQLMESYEQALTCKIRRSITRNM